MATSHEPTATGSLRMSLGEHLKELRKRLARGVLGVLVAFFVGWAYYAEIAEVLCRPLYQTTSAIDAQQVVKYEALLAEERAQNPAVRRDKYFRTENPEDQRLWPNLTVDLRPIQTGLGDGFMFSMKIALGFALVAGGPVLLYQLWQFIAAGLYPRERRLVLAYFPFSVLLFAAGVAFGFFTLLPFCMKFMAQAFPVETMGAMYTIDKYWDFLSTMSLALGGIFQLPILMYALVHVDLIERATFARYRGHFVLFAFVFGGIITPPDPWSQIMVAAPMVLLYEIGLLATWPMARRRARERANREGAAP